MNGNFEVQNSAYPIGYLRIGDGYKVTNMLNLTPLHSEPIGLEKCVAVAARANLAIREKRLDTAGLSDFVADAIENWEA